MIGEVLLAFFFTASAVQLLFWLLVFSRLARYRENAEPGPCSDAAPVSVVICARNEAENLRRHLPHFLNQNYRSYEVIVVNDNSSDDTGAVLLDFKVKSPILRVVTINEDTLPGKKAALTRGIAAASFEKILLSDADCWPSGPHWLSEMQQPLSGSVQIGLGYSPYVKRKGWLNLFVRYEAFYTSIQYLSFTLAGFPYMGVGRNLIYQKTLYDNVGGFKSHAHLASGDDDLFVNEAANTTNTKIVIKPTAFVYSIPKSSWRGYYMQKRRHLTTGVRYRPVHQLLLGALSLSHFLHYALGIGLLIGYPAWQPMIILLYWVRIGVVSTLCVIISRKLTDPALGRWAPLLDVIFVAYYLLFAPVLLIGKRDQWI